MTNAAPGKLVKGWFSLQYYIENGVRRAVAAREAGLKQIPAFLYEPGKQPQLITVDRDVLHSPKSSISQSHRRYL
ncbi:MAG: hypothetical protein FJ303_09640 [Planctomycetes bacterium]|nr:hypothetical protein [Planctomycetota bacterium]